MFAPVPESLHGDERLLENGLGSEGDLAKDKTGEDSSERLLPRDGEESADFPVGVDGDFSFILLVGFEGNRFGFEEIWSGSDGDLLLQSSGAVSPTH